MHWVVWVAIGITFVWVWVTARSVVTSYDWEYLLAGFAIFVISFLAFRLVLYARRGW